MTWLQLRFICDAATAADLAEHLCDCGALAVSLDDAEDEAIYEPPPGATPLWSHTRVSGLFPREDTPQRLLAEIERRIAPGRLPEALVEVLENQEWVRQYQDAFTPACFGERLWVVPSWAEAPPLGPAQVSMRLDPGLAFGTGSHATTRMCLDWLSAEDLQGRLLVDYGCGSGILSLAAAKLGARRVLAVDNDLQALDAARLNTRANALETCIEVHAARQVPALRADLLVSNILANTLSSLAQTFATLLEPGGRLALAGILNHQCDAVRASFAPWCTLHTLDERDGWVLLTGTRNQQPGA